VDLMATLQNLISYSLYGLAGAASVCFLLLILLYRYNEKKEQKRLRQTRTDIADMTILFQTMRDIISQQKTLAKEFNRELEKKMNLVKQVLARGMERNEELYEKQQVLNREAGELRDQLRSMQREMAWLSESAQAVREDNTPGETAPEPLPAQESNIRNFVRHDPAAPPPIVPPEEEAPRNTAETPAHQKQPQPASPETAEEADEGLSARSESGRINLSETEFARWIMAGEEVEGGEDEEDGEQAAVIPPEQPENPEAARAAFRTLLNLESPLPRPEPVAAPGPPAQPEKKTGEAPAPPSAGEGEAAFSETRQDDNGKRNLTPAQKRVLEYSDAGMSVAEISRELGIGKGEVRLMLSLVKQNRR
jgi:hypothetical protein